MTGDSYMLKMVKIQINLDIKADTEDEEDLKERLYDKLLIQIENDEVYFDVLEEEDEIEMED